MQITLLSALTSCTRSQCRYLAKLSYSLANCAGRTTICHFSPIRPTALVKVTEPSGYDFLHVVASLGRQCYLASSTQRLGLLRNLDCGSSSMVDFFNLCSVTIR